MQAEALQVGSQSFVRRYFITTWRTATQVTPEPFQYITVQTMRDAMRMTVTKIHDPALQGLVQPTDHDRQRHPTPLWAGLFADFVAQALLGLPRWFHAQVGMAATK